MGCSASIDERPAGGPGPFPSVTASAGFESVAKFDHTGLPNEDRCICEKVRKGVYLFTVIDGHKGTICSDFVRDHLHTHIKKQPGMEVLGGELRDPRQALVDGYLETDVAFLKCMDTLEKQVVMLDGVEIDITDDLRSSGACATSALIVGSELFVANAGDCRTLVCRSGLSLNLTVDQNCLRLDERQRVEAAGAFVLQNRVFGDLAVRKLAKDETDGINDGIADAALCKHHQVTRSFGDRGFKFTAAESQAVNHPDKDPASESDEADSLADLRSAAPGDLPHPKAAVETSPKEYINDPVAAKTPLTAKPEIETHTLKVQAIQPRIP
eukprot:SAG31_NODE_229_length_19770_cov_9.887194_1_plen_326_part_00